MAREYGRRKVLAGLIGGALCPVCAGLSGRVIAAETAPKAAAAGHGAAAGKAAGHDAVHWGYGGAGSPDKWGTLEADFRVCSLGMEQSPINLSGPTKAQLATVVPSFAEMPLTILHNGHTIQVNCAPGSKSMIDGQQFDLLQFHFHHPSEHVIDGKPAAMELHFVHRNAAGNLAVLGVMMEAGADNKALAPIWAAMPMAAGPAQTTGTIVAPAELLPAKREFWRYQGSLTTPPCSEGVLWTVFRDPIQMSPAQVAKFAQLFPVNARPPQGRGRRFLLETM
jgi:carbonic anhydrase